jgi:hypothetical protein
VITINIADEQASDRVDEALQFYAEFNTDGVLQHYRKHVVTEDDVTQQYIDIPENILYITRLLPFTSHTRNMFSIEYQMHLNDIYDLRYPGSIISYTMAKQYMELVSMTFDSSYSQQIRFSRHMNRLFIDADWSTDIKVGDTLVFECYSTINPDEYVNVYNDMFLKRYLTALIKRNWGTNLKKFTGMQLPGGVEMNGQSIYDEAQEEIVKLEEEVYNKFTIPPIGFIA